MAGKWRTTYKYSSLHLGIPQFPVIQGGDATIAADGFLVLEIDEPGCYVAQSIANWQMYEVKVLKQRFRPVTIDQVQEDEFLHPAPPEVRVSTLPPTSFTNVRGESRVLTEDEHFQRLKYFYSDGENWTLYYEYLNGGSLEFLIRKYYDRGWVIPEIFIWHVAAELSKALAYLYFGWTPENRLKVRDWTMAYHRAVTPSNIFLDYLARKPGAKPRVGIESNAFPRVVLSNFSHSAIEDDDDAWLKPGLHVNEMHPNIWEDVYHLGCVLRLMCMTHIPLGEGLIDHQHARDERGEHAWSHRPDSRFLRDVNITPALSHPAGPGYSDLLMDILGTFEWDGQEDMNIAAWPYRGSAAPSIDWVVDTLLPHAEIQVESFRQGVKPRDHFTNVDVSWTRPCGPLVPILFNDEEENALDRTEYLLKTKRDFMENCEIQFPLPKYREMD
ncbi:hypothetical protein F4813DRAFT_375390 [Daldinia decipiens]|uniref:uncharacterized protein n=1 Tax=Daldinia decipiens TaxID=326647 RepID=UPI0020C3E269|nr:uncharacterized protein F4813DRAFT_375390 [Daldinia decipiens]KAI1653208.1 hypothetical protein F4813DRAFT_375390 [Daldinia decipiens]